MDKANECRGRDSPPAPTETKKHETESRHAVRGTSGTSCSNMSRIDARDVDHAMIRQQRASAAISSLSSADHLLRIAWRLVPQQQLSRLLGRFWRITLPPLLRKPAISAFARTLGANMSEAEKPLGDYPSIHDFLTRRLSADAPRLPGRAQRLLTSRWPNRRGRARREGQSAQRQGHRALAGRPVGRPPARRRSRRRALSGCLPVVFAPRRVALSPLAPGSRVRVGQVIGQMTNPMSE